MANDRIERQLQHLNALRAGGTSDGALKELSKALADKVNVIVAKAAGIAAEWEARTLTVNLLEAYSRLFAKVESDPQCWGKLAIAKCLKDFGFPEAAPFVRGLQHFQWESTWGGKTDTAAGLRSTCVLALVQCTDLPRHETLVHLVNAITEPDANVRTDAVRAAEQMGGREVMLLLRLKARAGDKETHVTGQVLEALLAVEGPAAVHFVVQFLHSANAEECDEAALALGASRLNEAVEALKDIWLNPRGIRPIPALLRAISASRLDTAIDFLLEQIRDGRPHTAAEVLKAMDLHRDSSEIVKRIGEAVSEREALKNLYRDIYHVRS